MNLEKKKLRK